MSRSSGSAGIAYRGVRKSPGEGGGEEIEVYTEGIPTCVIVHIWGISIPCDRSKCFIQRSVEQRLERR